MAAAATAKAAANNRKLFVRVQYAYVGYVDDGGSGGGGGERRTIKTNHFIAILKIIIIIIIRPLKSN